MSIIEPSMDFQTTYRHDFIPKKGSIIPYSPLSDSNPVASPWYQYLVPDKSSAYLLPANCPYEDPACVLHRAYQNHLPDLELVKQQLQRQNQSLYQFDFCKVGDFDSKKTREAKIVPLPPGWSTPLTTQRCSYRDPKTVMTRAVEPPRYSYNDNLIPNEMEREILRVRTGESDYTAHIGALGDFIIREKLYGTVRPRGLSVWELRRREALLERED